jgi:hypothetical protein
LVVEVVEIVVVEVVEGKIVVEALALALEALVVVEELALVK